MTEWLRDGLEGRSLKATLRLYLLGLMVLAPAAAVLALVFGGQAAFLATPLLVLILVAVEYALPYSASLRKDFGELFWMGRPLIEIKGRRGLSESLTRVLSPDSLNVGTDVEAPIDGRSKEETLESLVHRLLYDIDPSVRCSAAIALGAVGRRLVVDRLINALQDKDPTVRYWVAAALMEIGDPRCIEPIVSALGDDAPLRSSPAVALRRIGSLPAERAAIAKAAIAKDVVEAIRCMVNIDESDAAALKNKVVSKPVESVRKRAERRRA